MRELRKSIIIMMTFVVSILLWNSASFTVEAFTGAGTESDPYLIETESDLRSLSSSVNRGTTYIDKYFLQTQDIELTSNFTPIGNDDFMFAGSYDGGNYEISALEGVVIGNENSDYQGLFGYVGGYYMDYEERCIENVVLSADVVGQYCVGGIVGFAYCEHIKNCSYSGTVSGDMCVGGLVGYLFMGEIEMSYTTGTVSGDEYVGGLVCSCLNGSIIDSYSLAAVSGGSYVGGIAAESSGVISTCYSAGQIIGEDYVGAIVLYGEINDDIGTVENCYYSTDGFMGIDESAGVVGLTAEEMTGENAAINMVGFDFTTVWYCMLNEFPMLRSNAQHEKVTITLHYVDGGITEDKEVMLTYGTCLSGVEDPTKAYYAFGGWYYDSAYLYPLDSSEVVTEDLDLYAKWVIDLEGDGTEESPYEIANEGDLLNLAAYLMEGINTKGQYYIQTEDIELTEDFPSMGYYISESDDCLFQGTYDGDYYEIMASEGVVIGDATKAYQGLFAGLAQDAVVKNVVMNVPIVGLSQVGSIAGINYGAIENSSNEGEIIQEGLSGESIGGIVGVNYGIISRSYNAGIIRSANSNNIGGIAGENHGTIENCYNTEIVMGDDTIGGIVGYNTGTIKSTYNIGMVISISNGSVGNVIGSNNSATAVVENCYYDSGKNVGGNNIAGITGLTLEQMTGDNAITYMTEFDFENIWEVVDYNNMDLTPMLRDNAEYGLVFVTFVYQDGITEDTTVIMQRGELIEEPNVKDKEESIFGGWYYDEACTEVFDFQEAIRRDTILYAKWSDLFEGEGTEENPYLITSEADLIRLSDEVASGKTYEGIYFLQTIDIELTEDFTTIGSSANHFKGIYDGGNNAISTADGVVIGDTDEKYQGLFGYIDGDAVIRNVIMKGTVVGASYVGGIAGYINSNASVEHCYNVGSVSGTKYIGGIAGYSRGTIVESYNIGSVEGESYVDNIVGYNRGTISNTLTSLKGSVLVTQTSTSENTELENTVEEDAEEASAEEASAEEASAEEASAEEAVDTGDNTKTSLYVILLLMTSVIMVKQKDFIDRRYIK